MLSPFLLTYKDSNFERLNQNQLCYHYTIGQQVTFSWHKCSDNIFTLQIFLEFFTNV